MNGIYDEGRLALHAIWTRRWLALAVAWGVCVLGWLVVSQMPSRYESACAHLRPDEHDPARPTMNAPPQSAAKGCRYDPPDVGVGGEPGKGRPRHRSGQHRIEPDRDIADRVAGPGAEHQGNRAAG